MWGCCLCWMALSPICISCLINGQWPKGGQGGRTSYFTDRVKLGQKFQVHATPEVSMMEAWVTGVMGHFLCAWSGLRYATGLTKTLYISTFMLNKYSIFSISMLCCCWIVCLCVGLYSLPHISMEDRKGYQILWRWSHRQLWLVSHRY